MRWIFLFFMAATAIACGAPPIPEDPADRDRGLVVGPGVDATIRVIAIGALNDLSGPEDVVTSGRSFAAGKRLLAAHVNAGGPGLLPPGWTVRLVEADHAGDPAQALAAYEAMRDDVLFVTTSFGAATTLALIESLEADDMMAFPSTPVGELSDHPLMLSFGVPYVEQAERAAALVSTLSEAQEEVRSAVVYDATIEGRAFRDAFRVVATRSGLSVVAEHETPPIEDVADLVKTLRAAQITHVMLAGEPPMTEALLRQAARAGFRAPVVGWPASWTDAFFVRGRVSRSVFSRFYLIEAAAVLDEVTDGEMTNVESDPDAIASYLQGRWQLEALGEALRGKDVTRAGFRSVVDARRKEHWPMSEIVVAKPDFRAKRWVRVGLNASADPSRVTAP